jgi:hypothetical protein
MSIPTAANVEALRIEYKSATAKIDAIVAVGNPSDAAYEAAYDNASFVAWDAYKTWNTARRALETT